MRRTLPLPIAQAMGRALESIHPTEQMKEWRMTMDVLISYINAIVSSEYCSTTPVSKIDERLRQDPQQTDSGRGNIQLGSIFKRIQGKGTLFSEPFRKWYYSELELNNESLPVCEHLKRLVTLRNRYPCTTISRKNGWFYSRLCDRFEALCCIATLPVVCCSTTITHPCW